MSRWVPLAVALAFSAEVWASPARAAEPAEPLAAVAYGFDGLWTGAQIGLASGYLATGPEYESHEWRKLVWGAGLGALIGVGVGLGLGVVDVSSGPPLVGRRHTDDVDAGAGQGARRGGFKARP